MAHSSEPWIVGTTPGNEVVSQTDGRLVAVCQLYSADGTLSTQNPEIAQANARRIALCVNLLWHMDESELIEMNAIKLKRGFHWHPVQRRNYRMIPQPQRADVRVIRNFPLLADRIDNALRRNGITTREQLEWHTADQLLHLWGLGEGSVQRIRDHYTLRDPESDTDDGEEAT